MGSGQGWLWAEQCQSRGEGKGLVSKSLAWHDRHLLWPTDLHVGITKRLKTVEVLEGQSCSFECVLSHENTGDVAVWTVGGKTVGGSGRFRATRQGRKYTLAVHDAAPSDAGEVAFSVQDLTSKASLIVRGGHPRQGRVGACLHGLKVEWGLRPGPGEVPVWRPRDTCWGAGGFSHLRDIVQTLAEAGFLVSSVWSDGCGSPQARGSLS